uniref:Chondroadherin-like b n=1 Tax=Takifugu rubripes TaxID=31033 RepID=H2V380_TAKRU
MHPEKQLCPNTLWALLLGLLLNIPATHPAKCPQQCICDQIQLNVACVRKNLTQVPPDITVKLDLRGNDIQELPTGAFRHTPYLTHLSMQRCNIRHVKEGAFRGLGRLVFLNLANNNIEILYQESFDGLSSLKQLLIDHNRVEEIQPGAFSQLGFLNLLSITHNQLVYIPNLAFQGLQNIKWLRLSHNSLNYLDIEAFAGLFTLTRLSLDHNELQLPVLRVTRLDLGYNPMTYLGEESVSMAKLTHLFLDHMSLQELSNTAVSRCPSLVHLDISYNQLRVIQPFSEGSPKLARLNLAGNPISCNCYLRPLREWSIRYKVKLMGTCGGPAHMLGENLAAIYPAELRCQSQEAMLKAELEEASRIVPPPTEEPENKIKCPVNCVCEVTIKDVIKLQHFAHLQVVTQHSSCENRGHTKIPRGFSPDTRLLDLRGNQFHYIPSNSFPGVAQVVSLHLQRSKIVEVEEGAFSGMKGLIYLYLSENDLTSLSPDELARYLTMHEKHLLISGLPALLALHLENNAITRLEPDTLAGMSQNSLAGLGPGLRSLFLEGNRLEEVPDFHPLTSLEVINLADNPLMCDCPLLPLRLWIEKVNLKVRATCANPPEIKGRKIKDVHVFRACPGGETLPTAPAVTPPKLAKAPKANKPKPMYLSLPAL